MLKFEGMILSVIYVVLGFAVCSIFVSITADKFCGRKLLHILMANWWFIRLRYMSEHLLILGPLLFVIINSVYSYKKDSGNMGMPLFAVALSIFSFATVFDDKYLLPSTIAVLVLGYADSGAALAGRIYQKKNKLEFKKSSVGLIAFFLITVVTVVAVLGEYHEQFHTVKIICFSLFLACSERWIFPKYDNLVVPLIAFFLFYKFY
ncbi:MAG TPA: hypothetical protein IAA26_05415 [Candidatus Blautia faecipullorum]|nr:hypothetical protein [Candidatus Blautia faecipullorum]